MRDSKNDQIFCRPGQNTAIFFNFDQNIKSYAPTQKICYCHSLHQFDKALLRDVISGKINCSSLLEKIDLPSACLPESRLVLCFIFLT